MKYGVPLLASLLLCLTGCATRPPETDFHLTAIAPTPLSPPSAGVESNGSLRIAVDAVAVPDIVDRSQMVFDEGDGRVLVDEQNRWAEPLKSAIGRVVALDLSQFLRTPQVSAYPQVPWSEPQYRVRIDIQRWDIQDRHAVVLGARWSVQGQATSSTSSPPRYDGTSSMSVPVEPPGGVGACVAAQDSALARLSQDIAKAIEHLQNGHMP